MLDRASEREALEGRDLGDGGLKEESPAFGGLSALVCAEVARVDPGEVVDRLRERHRVVASVTPYRDRYVRFGQSVQNTVEDSTRPFAQSQRTLAAETGL